MATKTAMQELIGWIDKFPAYGLSRADVRHKATELLEKEKQMVIDAWIDGGKMKSSAKNAEQYCNQTYINETKQ